MWQAFVQDAVKLLKVIKICGAKVVGHVAFDFFRELFGCSNHAVSRGDGGRGEVLMLMENRRGDARSASVRHPHCPSAVVVKRGAEDKALAAVFGESTAPFGFVVDEGFHANGDEGSCVVVMGAVHVGVSGDFGVSF